MSFSFYANDSIHSIYAPVKYLNGERISLSEDSIKKMLNNIVPFMYGTERVYFDTSFDKITRIFSFDSCAHSIRVRTYLKDDSSVLHGFYYLSGIGFQFIKLYDRNRMIGETVIKNGKMKFEYISDGNIFVWRSYNKKGNIIRETIRYENDVERGFFSTVKGVTKYRKQKFSHGFIRDVATFYSYLNYPPLEWLNSFAGIKLDFFK